MASLLTTPAPSNLSGVGSCASDRRTYRLLLIGHFLLYAYFFQGGGWNQNARFDTVRALVEQGTFEITDYASNTGDVVAVGGRVFSNKSPGQSILAAPTYAAALAFERSIGLDPDDESVATANSHLLSIATCALPGAILVGLLFSWFRRQGASVREASLLASGFGTGSLLLPYSGLLMNHVLTACLLFAAWDLLVVRAGIEGAGRFLAGGCCAGGAALVEPIAAPAAAIFVLLGLRASPRRAWPALLGPAVCALAYLAHNQVSFGHALVSGYTVSDKFRSPGLLLGVFDWPDPRRLIWLTVHPFRGLFRVSPALVVPLLGVSALLRRRPSVIGVAAGLPIVTFLLFNLSFNGWTGGWAVGPRYLIPATPFLWSFALPGLRRLPKTSVVLMAISTLLVLAVTAVRVMVPAPNGGEPLDLDPVRVSLEELSLGRVSTLNQSVLERIPRASPHDAWDSYNLGEVAGLRGASSLIPALALVVACWILPLFGAPGGWGRVPLRGRPAHKIAADG